ncbi:MAG TPA: 30S ribosome-binding factor RbfA [Anaerolineales bacterium]|nr:30S ribosome-binding factor RbfA [Anaerolineales bacterium]
MVSQSRASRIAKGIQEILSELLLFEVTDPRLRGVFVTDVRVDRELAQAAIFVSALEGAQRAPEILAGLDHASGYLRTQLARRTQLRVFPRLRFEYDPTPESAERIEELIASLHKAPEPKPEGTKRG